MVASAENRPVSNPCLSSQEVALLLSGRWPSDQFESAIAHLDHCQPCRELAEASNAADGSLGLGHEPESSWSIESACQIAMGRLLAENQFAAQPDTASPAMASMIGPYKLLGAIGQGGMGTVYLAQHERLRRKCAIKFLPPARVADAGWLDRFDREMTAVAAMEHPNIVRATDAGHQSGWHYLVMEYLDGLDVGKVTQRLGQLGVADACQIIREAALGLAHVHSHGLVHRDVKPSNLMLTRDGNVKLLDLGLVLAGDDPLAVDDRLTTVGHLMGTMPYMSPEQLMDPRRVEPSADIYSLGATLYRLIAGQTPHPNRRGIASQVLAITGKPITPLVDVGPDCDTELSLLADAMLSRDPCQRPTALEVADTMTRWSEASALKRLVRRASRIETTPTSDLPSPEFSSPPFSSPMQSLASPPQPPPGRWPLALLGGLGAAALFLAGVVLIIQTERGKLVVASENDDARVTVQSGGPMVDRLNIERGDQDDYSLRQGTFQVDIDGASHGINMDDQGVTIRGESAEAIADPSMLRLFRGEPLRHWMDVLVREQDSEARSTAMRATELLSRETPDRRLAAQRTMGLADELGGMVIGTHTDSSHYMDAMRSSFPAYFPQPGFDIALDALHSDDARANMAASWMIQDFVDGAIDETFYDQRKAEATKFIRKLATGDDGDQAKLDRLLDGLRRAANLDGTKTDASEPEVNALKAFAFETGLTVVSAAGEAIPIPTWIDEHVKQKFDDALPFFEDDPMGLILNGNAQVEWLMRQPMIEAAIRLRAQRGLELPASMIAHNLFHVNFYAQDHEMVSMIEGLETAFPDGREALVEAAIQRLHKIALGDLSGEPMQLKNGMGQGMGMGGGMVSRENYESLETYLGRRKLFWAKAIDLLGSDEKTPQTSLDVLRRLRGQFNSGDPLPESIEQTLTRSIEQLEKRAEPWVEKPSKP